MLTLITFQVDVLLIHSGVDPGIRLEGTLWGNEMGIFSFTISNDFDASYLDIK